MKNILYHESIIVEIKSLFHIMKITVLALFIFAELLLLRNLILKQ